MILKAGALQGTRLSARVAMEDALHAQQADLYFRMRKKARLDRPGSLATIVELIHLDAGLVDYTFRKNCRRRVTQRDVQKLRGLLKPALGLTHEVYLKTCHDTRGRRGFELSVKRI